MHISWRASHVVAAGTLVLIVAACRPDPAPASSTTAVYSRTTGRLEQIVSDEDGDGAADARAFMDGAALLRIELDRDADGSPDRWEYYEPAAGSTPGDGTAPRIVRAEEAHGPDAAISRREFFERGVLMRVEEDTDLDGRMDKWETYTEAVLSQVDLDLGGTGQADRRLVYGPSGDVLRVEADPDGDGRFEPLAADTPATGGTLP
jgi:hypothetical protein